MGLNGIKEIKKGKIKNCDGPCRTCKNSDAKYRVYYCYVHCFKKKNTLVNPHNQIGCLLFELDRKND